MTGYATISTSSGALKLANFIAFANDLNTFGGGIPTSGATSGQISGALTTIIGGPQANIDTTAQNIITAQQNACAGSGSSSTLCTQITAAMGTYTTNSQLLTNIQTYINAGH